MEQGTATQQGTGKALGPTEAPLQRARHHIIQLGNPEEAKIGRKQITDRMKIVLT